MRTIATADQIRAAEQRFFAENPGHDLMRDAAHAVAEHARRMLGHVAGRRVLVVAGGGNNGGDGLFAGAELAAQHARVDVWGSGAHLHREGRRAAVEAGCRIIEVSPALEHLAETDLVIDAVFGIGGRPGLPDDVAAVAAAAHDLGVPVLSVDLPSGLDADSPSVEQASFRATATVTFIAEKLCHVAEPAASRCGRVHLVDLGVRPDAGDVQALGLADVARLWPWPGVRSDKYSRGVVGMDTGSDEYTGAAVLGCTGAVHSGAGMVRYLGPSHPSDLIRALLPSVVHGAGRVQAHVAGSGWGDSPANARRLARLVDDGVPMVVDADAIALVGDTSLPDNSLLTPHAGELARLLGVERSAVEADPVAHARRAAEATGAAVLLKGATQYAVRPDGHTTIAVAGPSWTAQAGSGDTLAGACGTLLAAGLDADVAGALAASLQAVTAEAHPGPWPPDTLARWFPDALASLQRSASAVLPA